MRRFGCALRSFLRYCFLTGLVERDLSGAALPVSGRRRSLLPQGITPAQEKALLRACDRRRATGRRDYAVILLILRLGLRANEVATLRLDDMDWRAGQLTVHGKGNRVDQLPLPVDVGEAIAAYLCRGRPRSATAREVFLRVQPPLGRPDARRGELARRGGSASRRAWRGAPPSAAPHRGHRHAAGGRVAARDRPGAAPPLARHHRHLRAGRCRAAPRHRPALAVGGGVMTRAGRSSR